MIVCKPSQQQTALQRFQDKNIILKPVKDFKLLIIDRFKALSGEICFGGILLNRRLRWLVASLNVPN